MTLRQTAASKEFNSHIIHRGIAINVSDQDGDIWRGCIITGVGEAVENNVDIHADGEGVLGLMAEFNPSLELNIDTVNSTAAAVGSCAVRGGGTIMYTYHDANATDALVMGAQVTGSTTVSGYADLGTDIEVDHLGMCMETLTCITTTYYAFKVLI